ncbi:hypothetical protein pipiens_018675, partial [Culex pipiens pipiens]
MASELRFALKRNRSKSSDHNTTATTLRTTASSRASPKDSEPSSEHRFHPLGPPYAQYEFDPKAVGHAVVSNSRLTVGMMNKRKKSAVVALVALVLSAHFDAFPAYNSDADETVEHIKI